jgi:FtsP/CotA-like multicopper oxidase with cupredoxin domain
MSYLNTRTSGTVSGLLSLAAAAVLLTPSAQAAAPGITGATFSLNAGVAYNSQPDGELIYSWGYGCAAGFTPTYAPAQFTSIGFCPAVQFPGPTLIVKEGVGVTFSVTLTNNLPGPAGNTSIVFPGLTVTAAPAASQPSTCTATTPTSQGLMTLEAAPGCAVTYTVSIPVGSAGTHNYQSGTQPDLQIEMGLFGAVIVLPSATYANCTASWSASRQDYRLAPSAYDNALTCYDREYLWQWSEIDPSIHRNAESQIAAIQACASGGTSPSSCPTQLNVPTEPYHPNYFLINARSMPDDMDPDYAPNYPNQPYNGNPHMHPGELVLIRTIGQGHWQHTFHEHGNHVHILARDGNLMLAQANNPTSATWNGATPSFLAGRLEFDTDTTPGQAFDGIFYWSGKGLGWDIFGHTKANTATNAQFADPPCVPDVNGYYTTASGALTPTYTGGTMTSGSPNYYEWCADHEIPLESNPITSNAGTGITGSTTGATFPTTVGGATTFAGHTYGFGQVGGGGPMTLMDPLIVTNGLWFNGTPYLSQDAVNRSRGAAPLPPGSALQNPPAESGIAFMWHSHNEREITTNDVFPGGMLMIMLVDPYVWNIDETL